VAPPKQTVGRIDPAVRHVACIGLMAAARTSVGDHVAADLGWRLVEVDAEVEARTGKTVAELAYEGGEEAYRPWERQIVVEELAGHERSVVVAPGGIALDPEARAAIGAVDVVAVYLRSDPDALATLAEHELEHELLHEHPVFGRQRLEILQRMFRDRDATYRALADVEVRIDERSHEDSARLVVAAITGEAARAPRAVP
jgi:shikimate kinase